MGELGGIRDYLCFLSQDDQIQHCFWIHVLKGLQHWRDQPTRPTPYLFITGVKQEEVSVHNSDVEKK